MSAVFLTGATGFLGSYVVDRLLRADRTVTALVRAADADQARMRLWRSLQLHLPADTLAAHLDAGRLRFVLGDLTEPRLGLSVASYLRVIEGHDTVVHTAATLNRRSSTACFNVNLRGGLELLQLVRRIEERGSLRRYAHVSTVAVAGQRHAEVVEEDSAIEWDRSDWDPYARTKSFGEHLVDELLPGASTVIVRPSIVMGDSRFPETTQFDMVRAFVTLARLPVLPFDPKARLDIVPADFVADGLTALVLAERPRHRVYHLSAGRGSPSFAEVSRAVSEATGSRSPLYLPRLGRLAAAGVKALSNLRHPAFASVRQGMAMMDVFWPYLDWDVVFANERVVAETGVRPTPFTQYCGGLMQFALAGTFRYPFRPLPQVLADTRAGELRGGDAPVGGEALLSGELMSDELMSGRGCG